MRSALTFLSSLHNIHCYMKNISTHLLLLYYCYIRINYKYMLALITCNENGVFEFVLWFDEVSYDDAPHS